LVTLDIKITKGKIGEKGPMKIACKKDTRKKRTSSEKRENTQGPGHPTKKKKNCRGRKRQ